jgi:exodeoxyribonuclease VII small subunit
MVPVERETFESVYTELEDAVRRLEDGGLPLEESIALFERGMTLAQRCREMLASAELRVTTLTEEFRAAGAPAGGSCQD